MEVFQGPVLCATEYSYTKKELKGIVEGVEAGNRLSVTEVAGLLNHNSDVGSTRAEVITAFGIPGSLILGHVALETVIEEYNDALPSFGSLPDFWHGFLTNVAELPFFDQSEPASVTIRDHAPNFLLFVAGIYLGVEAARFLSSRSLHRRAKAAQLSIAHAYQEGSLDWKIEPGSSVAFIGDGDPMARKIASTTPRDILQISYTPTDGPWTLLPKNAFMVKETFEAFERADLSNAGELLFFPIKPSHEFLPQEGDHDISVGRMVNYITAADKYRSDLGLESLPVIIIGSKYQSETYVDADHSRTTDDEERCITLEQRMAALSEELGISIKIFDPTEIIIDKILELAQGRRLIFSGTVKSYKQYGEIFFSNTFGRQDEDKSKPVRVIYNFNDDSTVSDATPEDICVVLDPLQKQLLMHRGIPEEKVLVVPEEVLRVVGPLINRN